MKKHLPPDFIKNRKPVERQGRIISIAELVDFSPKLKRMGILDDGRQLEILRKWGEMVGPAVAQHTRPIRFKRGVLTVAVSSPVWMQELTLLKMKFVENLEKTFGKGLVTDIRFTSTQAPFKKQN